MTNADGEGVDQGSGAHGSLMGDSSWKYAAVRLAQADAVVDGEQSDARGSQ